MLKIVEKPFSTNPIRFIAKPGVELIAGYTCALVEHNGYLVCDICQPGQNPFGIIGETKYIDSDEISFKLEDMVPIWSQRMIFKTDNFEHSNYGPGDKLYVGESGMLTNEPVRDDSNFVARLTGYPDEYRDYYECLWI